VGRSAPGRWHDDAARSQSYRWTRASAAIRSSTSTARETSAGAATRGLVAFQDLDLFLSSRRTSDGEMKRVIATAGFCARGDRYDPFRHNAWILTE
jgi:hypothetical protein